MRQLVYPSGIAKCCWRTKNHTRIFCRTPCICGSCHSTHKSSVWVVLVAFAFFCVWNSIQLAEASSLASYRALYSMSLGYTSGTDAPSGLRGVMYYEFKSGCEAWTVDSKVYLHLNFTRQRQVESIRKMITWESKDGLAYRFLLSETHDGKITKDMRGEATFKVKGASGLVEYIKPRARTVELPKGTVFPTTHLVALIASSMSGENFLGTYLFDGASLDDPNMVSAVIQKRPTNDEFVAPVVKSLKEAAKWNARLAYFPIKSGKATPDFEMDVHFRQDGIVEGLVQDYNSYTIVARLEKIEVLPSGRC